MNKLIRAKLEFIVYVSVLIISLIGAYIMFEQLGAIILGLVIGYSAFGSYITLNYISKHRQKE